LNNIMKQWLTVITGIDTPGIIRFLGFFITALISLGGVMSCYRWKFEFVITLLYDKIMVGDSPSFLKGC
jgi:hypothetical protein